MKNIVILIHKKRNDIEEFFNVFPSCYIYADQEIAEENSYIRKIEHSGKSTRNVIGNGIRQISEDLPGYHIILVNETAGLEDIKKIAQETEKGEEIIIAKSSSYNEISKKKKLGIKIITRLFNLVHKQKANNIMSNIQGIPADIVQHFLKLRGDTCTVLINQRFIIKDHNLKYSYMEIESDVLTDAPNRIGGYLKCIFIICYVFIKFMISSISAFVLDYSLALAGYVYWSPFIANALSNLHVQLPGFLTDVEILSIGIARLISSIYNYIFNKKVVFAADKNVAKLSTACKYFTLVLIILVFNTIILKLATTLIGIPFAIAKVMADIIMYFVSFSVQRDLVFKKRNK
ncbi:MAG: GtrA family protein [Eubacteriales bacterium]